MREIIEEERKKRRKRLQILVQKKDLDKHKLWYYYLSKTRTNSIGNNNSKQYERVPFLDY